MSGRVTQAKLVIAGLALAYAGFHFWATVFGGVAIALMVGERRA